MHRATRTRLGGTFAVVFAVTTLALVGPSWAPPAALNVSFPALFQEGALGASVSLSPNCDQAVTAEEISFTFNGTPTSAVTASAFTTSGFSISIPDSLATEPAPATLSLEISVTCDANGSPVTLANTISWAQIQVSKTVVGDAPSGASFAMAVDCATDAGVETPPFEFELADGESWSVFAVTAGGCAVEETDDLGALSSTVTPAVATITSSSLFPVEVVNTFPVKPAPTPAPTPEPAPAVPAFTG